MSNKGQNAVSPALLGDEGGKRSYRDEHYKIGHRKNALILPNISLSDDILDLCLISFDQIKQCFDQMKCIQVKQVDYLYANVENINDLNFEFFEAPTFKNALDISNINNPSDRDMMTYQSDYLQDFGSHLTEVDLSAPLMRNYINSDQMSNITNLVEMYRILLYDGSQDKRKLALMGYKIGQAILTNPGHEGLFPGIIKFLYQEKHKQDCSQSVKIINEIKDDVDKKIKLIKKDRGFRDVEDMTRTIVKEKFLSMVSGTLGELSIFLSNRETSSHNIFGGKQGVLRFCKVLKLLCKTTKNRKAFLFPVPTRMPQSWQMVISRSREVSIAYHIEKDEAQRRYNIPLDITVNILQDSPHLGFFSADVDNASIFISIPPICNFDIKDWWLSDIESPNLIDKLYGTVLHECIHLQQYLLGSLSGSYTGLKDEHGQDIPRDYSKTVEQTQRDIRSLFLLNSLDTSKIFVHGLGDLEFYTDLFDEIMESLNQLNNSSPISSREMDISAVQNAYYVEILRLLDNSDFLYTLKHADIGKYLLALGEIKEALYTRGRYLVENFTHFRTRRGYSK